MFLQCFPYPFYIFLYGSYWGNGLMVENVASFKRVAGNLFIELIHSEGIISGPINQDWGKAPATDHSQPRLTPEN